MSGLFTLIVETIRRASDRHAALFAAGVAFYVFLSLFPASIAAMFSYGLIADADTMASHGERMAKFLPDDAASILTRQLDALSANPPGTLGWGVVTAVVVALWSASRGAFNLLKAVQWIFGLDDVRGAIRQRLLALSMMVGAIVFMIVSIALLAALPPLLSFFKLDEAWRLIRVGRWLFLGVTVVGSIGLLFRLALGEPVHPRDLPSRGVVMASGLWIAVSFGFSIYVERFADYGQTYGALTGVVVLMIWIWLSTLSVLYGAAFEAVSKERRRRR
jgi:membrane protein